MLRRLTSIPLRTQTHISSLKYTPRYFATQKESTGEPEPFMMESNAVGGKIGYGQMAFIGVLFCGGLYVTSNFIFNSQYKNTGAYKMSMKLLENNEKIKKEIGIPLKAYYSIDGRRFDGNKLYLQWKVAGPGGDATISCRSGFIGGKGTILELTAELDDKSILYLVEPEKEVVVMEGSNNKE